MRATPPTSTQSFRNPLALLMLVILGCSVPSPQPPGPEPEAPSGPPWFEDVTESAGIAFTHDPGLTGTYFMPGMMGSGCAFLDIDGDGLLDIYLLQNAGPDSKSINRLYRQGP